VLFSETTNDDRESSRGIWFIYKALFLIIFHGFCAAFSSPVRWLSLQECSDCAEIAFVSEEVRLFGAFTPELDSEGQRVNRLFVTADE